VIEMNPRVSRSSALASEATGFPIAKVAAKLAVGYTLDELKNDITGGRPASFEPIDYVVTKIPRFAFEKFHADARLTTQMKSVGEVMAIGRTFQESLQKALRGWNRQGRLRPDRPGPGNEDDLQTLPRAERRPERLFFVADAFRAGMSVEEISRLSFIDHWFLDQIEEIIAAEAKSPPVASTRWTPHARKLKRAGFSDARLAQLTGTNEAAIRALRRAHKVRPVYKRVDSCAGEFSTGTAYLYSTYEDECEAAPSNRDKIMILGGGPNRIGQGIEFDYCCVRRAGAARRRLRDHHGQLQPGNRVDRLRHLRPPVLRAADPGRRAGNRRTGKPKGVIVQYGGQTPLKLARALEANGVPVIGTSPDSIDLAEDRERFQQLVDSWA
jgi:carbamoyl-phosphate synthase large subunit